MAHALLIDRVDPADDTRMRAVYDVGCRSKAVDRPWFQPQTYAEWLPARRTPDPDEDQELYAAIVDDQVVGTSLLYVPLSDNLNKVYLDLDVDPSVRRQGHGGALIEHLVARAGELGRRLVFTGTKVPPAERDTHPVLTFARRHGFRVAELEVTRHLPLPVDDGLLADLAAEAAGAHGAAYRVETYAGRVPDDLLPGLAELMSLLAVDAPTGDVEFEAEAITPERLHREYALEAAQGRTRLSALAIHDDGTVAAQSDLVVPADPGLRVIQEGTFVHRAHRGHRLGMAVKAANLQRLQRDFPGRPHVVTGNEETNNYMVDINVALGFKVVELSPGLVRELR